VAGRVRRGTLAAAAALYAAVAASTSPLTGAATVLVVAPATAVLALAVRRRAGPGVPTPPADPPPADPFRVDPPRVDPLRVDPLRVDPLPAAPRLRRTAAAWASLVLLGGALEFVAWLRQPAYDIASPDHPTLSLLLDPVTGSGPGRFVSWCVWLYVGWRVGHR
jgi:hypothetical protein